MTNPLTTSVLFTSLLLLTGQAQAQTAIFAPAITYSSSSASRNLVLADVNSDGKLDVLTANPVGSTVGVLLGNGNGTFQPVATFSTGSNSNPYDVAVADVNGDGRPDLLTANFGTNAAGVLLGNGNGTFQAAVAYATGVANGRPFGIAVADLTGDGKPDLLTANYQGYNVSLFAGTGTGTFQAASSYAVTANSVPLDVAITDVNADGRLDALIASAGSNTVAILASAGGPGFQPGPYAVGPGASFIPYGVAAADVNNDGRPDVVTTNAGNNTVSVLLNGGGSLGAATNFQNSGVAETIAVADVNGDGKADLLTANPSDQAVSVLLGTGTGSFLPFTRYATGPGTEPHGLAVADLNGDGRPDVVTANYGAGTISVLLNTTPLAARAALPGASATLYPNPATTAATLTLAGLPATVARVQATLLDATGRAVSRYALPIYQGSAQAEVPTTGLAAGLYVLRLAAEDARCQLVGNLPAQRLSVH